MDISKILGREPIESRVTFRHFVLSRLRECYPTRDFGVGLEPETIVSGDAILGLQNLFDEVTSQALSGKALEQHVRERLDGFLAVVPARTAASWEATRSKLRLQFVPEEYPLGDSPWTRLAPGIVSVIVENFAQGYAVVPAARLSSWNQPILHGARDRRWVRRGETSASGDSLRVDPTPSVPILRRDSKPRFPPMLAD